MAGVKLSLLWSLEGWDSKLYPQWAQGRTRRSSRVKKEIPQPRIVEVEPIEVSLLKVSQTLRYCFYVQSTITIYI